MSSTPVTVTVCAVSQFDVVNVNGDGDTTASPVSDDVTANTTSEKGWASSTTVKLSEAPASVTVAVVFDTVTPAEAPAARFPEESNFTRNISFEVKLTTPSPGSRSTVS